MGLYDTIRVHMRCPNCKIYEVFSAQTKDLGRCMYQYSSLPTDWFSEEIGIIGKQFREKAPTFAMFPLDREHEVWENQAEKMEAQATVLDEYEDLEEVSVVFHCNRVYGKEVPYYTGKIKIQDGMLIGRIYDVEELGD